MRGPAGQPTWRPLAAGLTSGVLRKRARTRDDKLLAEQLKELSLIDLDFELEVIGFDMGEIDLRIENLEGDGKDDEDDPADAIP
jgi:hypothetical protein